MIEFDPNNLKQPKFPPYATYIPARSPKFKTHTSRNHATNAVNYRANGWGGKGSPGIIYQYIDGQWLEIDRFEPPTHCAHCDRDFNEVDAPTRYYAKVWIVHDRAITPAYRQKRVCRECYERHWSYSAPEKLPVEYVGKIDRGDSIDG